MLLPKRRENYWISLSDIMTGLMIIFMFIAITYIRQMQKDRESMDNILIEYRDTNVALLKALHEEFGRDFEADRWHAELNDDLSIRFLNEQVLFDYNSDTIKPEFASILSDFFPRYLGILLSPEFKDKIAEVRIEGHTDSQGGYEFNVNLSQRRTANVLYFMMNRDEVHYSDLPSEDRELTRYWFTANGFSFGRTLDDNGNYTIYSQGRENRVKSRRVEFRIVTKSEEVVNQILMMMNNN